LALFLATFCPHHKILADSPLLLEACIHSTKLVFRKSTAFDSLTPRDLSHAGVVEVHATSTTSTKQATERALLIALNCFYEQLAQVGAVPSFVITNSSDGVPNDSVYNSTNSAGYSTDFRNKSVKGYTSASLSADST
jgi:hypothetical protein